MDEPHVCNFKQSCIQLHNGLQIRLNRIKEIEDIFHREINHREKMSKALNKYITALKVSVVGI